MRLILLTALTMVAFAGNSLLNRMAIVDAAADPATFALVRVIAGAAVLALLLALRRGPRPRPGRNTLSAVLGLTGYLAAFSVAYVGLAAVTGALLLGQRLAPLRIGGAGPFAKIAKRTRACPCPASADLSRALAVGVVSAMLVAWNGGRQG